MLRDFHLLAEELVRRHITHKQAIRVVETTYREYSNDLHALSAPPAMSLHHPASSSVRFKVKGAVVTTSGAAGFRLVGDYESPERVEDYDYCFLFDNETAQPLALIDEKWLHRVRTAMTGVVAVKHLAPSDAGVFGLIGTGRIADEFVIGLAEEVNVRELRVTSRRAESAKRFAERHGHLFPGGVQVVQSPREAVEKADVVVTLSHADKALIHGDWLQPGTLVCAMGGRQELDISVLHRSDRFIVDDFEFATVAGSVAAWIRRGAATRAELERRQDTDIASVIAQHNRGRINPEDVVLAVVQGMAICDVALAKYVLDKVSCGDREAVRRDEREEL